MVYIHCLCSFDKKCPSIHNKYVVEIYSQINGPHSEGGFGGGCDSPLPNCLTHQRLYCPIKGFRSCLALN